MVIRILMQNTTLAQDAISDLVRRMGSWAGDFPVHSALRDALITDRAEIPASVKEELAPLVSKYLDS